MKFCHKFIACGFGIDAHILVKDYSDGGSLWYMTKIIDQRNTSKMALYIVVK